VLPSAVRKQEIQQPPLLACGLSGEQAMCILGQIQNLDTLVHVGVVGGPVPPFGKGLGMSKPKRPRISALGVNPNDDQKTLSKQQMIPHQL
jgi:hypothetical protein